MTVAIWVVLGVTIYLTGVKPVANFFVWHGDKRGSGNFRGEDIATEVLAWLWPVTLPLYFAVMVVLGEPFRLVVKLRRRWFPMDWTNQ